MRHTGYPRDTRWARLAATPEGLRFESSYHPDLVAMLKGAVPGSARSFSKVGGPHWMIDPVYGRAVAQICWQVLGVEVDVPAPIAATRKTETEILRIEYLGGCRVREDGASTATGYCNGQWSVIFPEAVLRRWFRASLDLNGDDARERPAGSDFYAQLGIGPTANLPEIRSAYRRLALQWHPDKTSEPGAAEVFKQITEAYRILTDPASRKKYDVGLRVQALCPKPPPQVASGSGNGKFGYRPLLRCGYVMAEGQRKVGRLIVSKILQWEDIVDEQGRTMVSSWPTGAETFEVRWVDP